MTHTLFKSIDSGLGSHAIALDLESASSIEEITNHESGAVVGFSIVIAGVTYRVLAEGHTLDDLVDAEPLKAVKAPKPAASGKP